MSTTPSLRPSATAELTRSIFVVDDHPAYRRAISSVIELTTGVRWCGEASSGADALRLLAAHQNRHPDLVVMDVHLGDITGIVATRELLADRPELRVLLVSTMAEVDLPTDASTCGAIGFVRKDRFGPAALAAVLDVGHPGGTVTRFGP